MGCFLDLINLVRLLISILINDTQDFKLIFIDKIMNKTIKRRIFQTKVIPFLKKQISNFYKKQQAIRKEKLNKKSFAIFRNKI